MMIAGEKVKFSGFHFTSVFTVSFRMVWVIKPTIVILGRVRKFNMHLLKYMSHYGV